LSIPCECGCIGAKKLSPIINNLDMINPSHKSIYP
jgi:hypothetical protein